MLNTIPDEGAGAHRQPARRWAWPVHLLAALLLATFVAALYFPLLFTNRVLATGDILLYFYPYREAVASALREGRIPFWNPYLFGGAPLLANPQAAVLYPLHWPLIWLPATQQVYWSAALHTWLLGLGGYALLRRWGVNGWGALAAGLVLSGGGLIGGLMGHLNQLNVAAWGPWAVICVEGARCNAGAQEPPEQRRTAKWASSAGRTMGLALVVALMLLAGHTQTAYIVLFGLGVWSLWPLAEWAGRAAAARQARQSHDREGVDRSLTLPALKEAAGETLARLAVYGGGVLIGALLSAPQLLPTLELSGLGIRTGGLSYQEATSFSLKPLQLLWTLLPTYGLLSLESIFDTPAYTEYVAYVGVLGLGLALLGAWRGRGRPRAFGLLFVALGLLLGLGRWNPLYFFLHLLVPGFDLFRVPARWLLLYTLGAAVLAGLGTQWLTQWLVARRQHGHVGVPADPHVGVRATRAVGGARATQAGSDAQEGDSPAHPLTRSPAHPHVGVRATRAVGGARATQEGSDAQEGDSPAHPLTRSPAHPHVGVRATRAVGGGTGYAGRERRPRRRFTRSPAHPLTRSPARGRAGYASGGGRAGYASGRGRAGYASGGGRAAAPARRGAAAGGARLANCAPDGPGGGGRRAFGPGALADGPGSRPRWPCRRSSPAADAAAGRFLGLSTITYDPGDMADYRRIMLESDPPQLDARAFDDLVIAQKVQELLVPNLALLWRIPTLDGFDGGVLPLQRYNQFAQLLVAAGGTDPQAFAPDGRLREQMKAIPSSALLNLANVQYLITDKVLDLWFEDVYYDRQIGATLDAAQPQMSIPIDAAAGDDGGGFEATHLDLIAAAEAPAAVWAELATAAAPVAAVEVRANDGVSLTLPITAGGAAGALLADGGLDSPLAQTSGAVVAYRDSEGGRQEYRVRLSFDTPLIPAAIRLRLLDDRFRVQVQAATLYDARTGMFTALLPSDRGHFERVHSGDVKIYANRDLLPRAYLAAETLAADGPAEAAALLQTQLAGGGAPVTIIEDAGMRSGDGSLAGTAGVVPPDLMPLRENPSTGTAEIVRYAAEEVVVRTRSEQPALLVLSDAFYPGWRATVDGESAAIYPANVLFRGVPVAAGEHTVVFTYEPDGWRLGWGLAAAGGVLIGLLGVCSLRGFRREHSGAV